MGGKQTTENSAAKQAANAAAELEAARREYDWGEAPSGPNEAERENMNELVLQTWASCKAKPSPVKVYRSDEEEQMRREGLKWRKRSSFVELDCGEDSFFVANTYKTVGIADGVGGWRDEGIDPSVFSNTFMRNTKLFAETHRDETDPQRIAEKGFKKTVIDGGITAGGATALVASIVEKPNGGHQLDVANLGDGGLIVIREGEIVHRAHEKVHGFNAPFQLSILPEKYKGRCFSDTMKDCVREQFDIKEGDVIVAGTDGLFDNRFPTQIAADAEWIGQTPRNVYDGVPIVGPLLNIFFAPHQRKGFIDPYRITQRLVQDAYKTSIQKDGQTPWALSLQDFGVQDSQGGKPDDITAMVSLVTTREEVMRATMW